MNTVVKRNVRQKVPKAKPTSTYLNVEEEQDFEFIIACTTEKLRLSSDGEEFDPISKAEMIRMLIAEKKESLKAEGWKVEQFKLPL